MKIVYLAPITSTKYPTRGIATIPARDAIIESTLFIVALNLEGTNLWKYIFDAGIPNIMKN